MYKVAEVGCKACTRHLQGVQGICQAAIRQLKGVEGKACTRWCYKTAKGV